MRRPGVGSQPRPAGWSRECVGREGGKAGEVRVPSIPGEEFGLYPLGSREPWKVPEQRDNKMKHHFSKTHNLICDHVITVALFGRW